MKFSTFNIKYKVIGILPNTAFITLILLSIFPSGASVHAQSSQEFIQNNDTLTVYKDVPGLTTSP
jgi:hypothetical protein